MLKQLHGRLYRMKYHLLILQLISALSCAPAFEGDFQEAGIIVPPVPHNTTLGATAKFYCDAVGDFGIIWKVDDLYEDNPALDTRGIDVHTTDPNATGIIHSTLTVSASIRNNGTRIRCVAASPIVESDEITLLIQGLLNSPSDVSIKYHDISRITLTWTSPFTLDITELDNDITYRICDNYTIACAESTITSHSFLTTHLPVEYSVSACNPVGCSENTTLVWYAPVDVSLMAISPSKPHYYSSPAIVYARNKQDSAVHFAVVGCSIGTAVVVIAVVIACIGIYVTYKRKKGSERVDGAQEMATESMNTNIQMESNSAYVTHQPRQCKIKTEPCPAYESVTRHDD